MIRVFILVVIPILFVSCTVFDGQIVQKGVDLEDVNETHCIVSVEPSVVEAPARVNISIGLYLPERPGLLYVLCDANRTEQVWTSMPAFLGLNTSEKMIVRSSCSYDASDIGQAVIIAGVANGAECSTEVRIG